jgi:peptidoglycan hydrolase-like protein with peptidoglycan-binding domain
VDGYFDGVLVAVSQSFNSETTLDVVIPTTVIIREYTRASLKLAMVISSPSRHQIFQSQRKSWKSTLTANLYSTARLTSIEVIIIANAVGKFFE